MGKLKKALLSLSAIFSASVLVMHGYLGNYTRFIADDFCSVYFADHFGLFRSIWFWRLNWSGRYSAFAVDWILAKIGGADSLSLIAPFLLIVWFVSTSAAVYFALRSGETEKRDLLLSSLLGVLFLFVIFSLAPDVQQSFYWWNGMRSYALPLITLTLYLTLYGMLPDQLSTSSAKAALACASFLLFFASGGLGETSTVFQFCLLAFLIILHELPSFKFEWDTRLIALTAGLLGSIVSLVVIITAPGNALRQGDLPPTTNLFSLLSISWQGYWDFLTEITMTPEKIATLVGALLLTIWLGRFYKDRIDLQSWQIPAYLLGGLLLSFACFPPGVYGYSEPPPTRILIIAVYALVTFMMFASFLGGIWFAKRNLSSAAIAQAALIAAVVLLGYSSILQTQALYQSRDIYISFAQSWDEIDAQIRAAKADREEMVVVPFGINWARLDTLTDNPRHYVNQCYSNYYGIDVRSESPYR